MITIDEELFDRYFSGDLLSNITENKYRVVREAQNKDIIEKYYGKLSNYAGRPKEAGFNNLIDLYASNVLILDYVLKYIDKFRNKMWLDYGCGMGMLIVYLSKLGIDCFGCDNWSHGLLKEDAEKFLSYYGLKDRLINLKEAHTDGWNIISSMGIWCEVDFRQCKQLEYVFDDPYYKAKYRDYLAGPLKFDLVENNKLIAVFKRRT